MSSKDKDKDIAELLDEYNARIDIVKYWGPVPNKIPNSDKCYITTCPKKFHLQFKDVYNIEKNKVKSMTVLAPYDNYEKVSVLDNNTKVLANKEWWNYNNNPLKTDMVYSGNTTPCEWIIVSDDFKVWLVKHIRKMEKILIRVDKWAKPAKAPKAPKEPKIKVPKEPKAKKEPKIKVPKEPKIKVPKEPKAKKEPKIKAPKSS